MKLSVLTFSILFWITSFGQTEAIVIQHKGPSDEGIPTITYLRDSSLIKAYVLNHNSGLLIIRHSSAQDFDLLKSTLIEELTDSTGITSLPTWGDMKIEIFDSNDQVIACRHLCCDQDSAEEFKRICNLPSIRENEFITTLLMMFVESIEEDLERR
jgi:hypothetical protein